MSNKDKDKILPFPTDYVPEKPTALSSDEYKLLNHKFELLADEIIQLSKAINGLTKLLKKSLKE